MLRTVYSAILRKGKPLYSSTSHRVENQRKKNKRLEVQSPDCANDLWGEKNTKNGGENTVESVQYDSPLEKARTHQVKGLDLDRAMELWINAHKCAINSSSTELGIILPLCHGDFTVFPSCDITHFNLHYSGRRCSIVLHTDWEMAKWMADRNGWASNPISLNQIHWNLDILRRFWFCAIQVQLLKLWKVS